MKRKAARTVGSTDVKNTNRILNGRELEGRPYGNLFYGTLGTLFVDRGGFEVFPETTNKDGMVVGCVPVMKSKRIRADTSHIDHVRDFLDCVRSRKPARGGCDINGRFVNV